MLRQEALGVVLRAFPTEPIVVTLGTTSREVIAAAPDAENHLHLLDSMGLAPAVGLGLALGLEGNAGRSKVVALEGDGGLLMGLSTLATAGQLRPRNLLLIVLDDGVYAATGGQWTGAERLDLCAVARGCGFSATEVSDEAALRSALEEAKRRDGPELIRARIAPTTRKLPFYLPDPPVLTDRFVRYLRSLRPARRA